MTSKTVKTGATSVKTAAVKTAAAAAKTVARTAPRAAPQYLVIVDDAVVGRLKTFSLALAFSLGYERARDRPGCTVVTRALGVE